MDKALHSVGLSPQTAIPFHNATTETMRKLGFAIETLGREPPDRNDYRLRAVKLIAATKTLLGGKLARRRSGLPYGRGRDDTRTVQVPD